MTHPRTIRQLLALLAVSCALPTTCDAGWLFWWRGKCAEPPAHHAPCLPESGYHATRWSRWTGPDCPVEGVPGEYATPLPVVAPRAFTPYASPPMTPYVAPAPLPFTGESARPAPVPVLPAPPPVHRPDPQPVGNDAPKYETREWRLSSFAGSNGETLPVSHEQPTPLEVVPRRATLPVSPLRPSTIETRGPYDSYRNRAPRMR